MIQITGIDFFSRCVYIKLQNKTQIKNTYIAFETLYIKFAIKPRDNEGVINQKLPTLRVYCEAEHPY